jgi:hypothetical protein
MGIAFEARGEEKKEIEMSEVHYTPNQKKVS